LKPQRFSIAVLGAGSWGTALAILLARNGHDVRLWGHDPGHTRDLAEDRENRYYLPGIPLPPELSPTPDLDCALKAADFALVVVPSHAFRSVLQQLRPHLEPSAGLAWATKGLEPGTNKLLHEVAREVLGNWPLAVVSGPTFAGEVARGLPTAVTVASASEMLAKQLAQALRSSYFRAYVTDDVIGVELGAAVKNVLAIAAGISDGLGFGANSRAALITRGLAEITRLGVALGGRTETFMGLAGLGDLALTCTDDQSRNRRMGLALARGLSIEQARREIGQEVEGVQTAREVYQLSRRLGVDMPITEQAYRVLYEGRQPKKAVQALFERAPKKEVE
jgi:glycerol-3-phosphate dehydrogenase (NAD(P)+)